MGSSHVGSESTNRMDVNGHNGEDLDGTNIDDIHGATNIVQTITCLMMQLD